MLGEIKFVTINIAAMNDIVGYCCSRGGFLSLLAIDLLPFNTLPISWLEESGNAYEVGMKD